MKIQRLNEEDPCWDGYTMVGTKMKNGEEVPNCVPDDEVENYDEATTTANVPGYNTPYAFSGDGDQDMIDQKREYLKKLNKQYGYTLMDDVLSEQALQDFKEWILPYAQKNEKVFESVHTLFSAGNPMLSEASSSEIIRGQNIRDQMSTDRFVLELEKRIGVLELHDVLLYIVRNHGLGFIEVNQGRQVYTTADQVRSMLGDRQYTDALLYGLSNDVLEPALDGIKRDYNLSY